MLAVLSATACLTSVKASAQDHMNSFIINKYDFTSDPKYQAMVEKILNGQRNEFKFRNFRSYYARTDAYDPVGEETREKLLNYAYMAVHSSDEATRQEAFQNFRALTHQHLANINVVIQALSFARQDPAFGDAGLYSWVAQGIKDSVMSSGDGLSQAGAYDILTLGEENLILGELKLKSLKLDVVKAGFVMRMHLVEDMRTGQRYTLFINATRPMEYMRAKAEEKEKSAVDLLPY